MTNKFKGLHTGPIDHQSTSVINAIADNTIDMGDVVLLITTAPIPDGELLPRVEIRDNRVGSLLVYGIAVGGDTDGIYGDGSLATDDTNRATTGSGQAIKIVTQGRCLAKVQGVTVGNVPAQINIGDPLSYNFGQGGRLHLATAGQTVIARALESVDASQQDIIAVDVKREGKF